jgi:hypothetical protein
MKQMGLDISLLCHFNLMDYSLLFVIEYNPEYVKRNPTEFERDRGGDFIYPIRPTKKKMQAMSNKNIAFDSITKKKEISEEFLAKMAVSNDTSLIEKYAELVDSKRTTMHWVGDVNDRHSFGGSIVDKD